MRKLILITISLCFFGKTIAQDLSKIGQNNPITLNGDFQARGMFYSANGIDARQDPFRYLFHGNLTANLYGLSIPFSFTYSPDDKKFRQPFNKFGLSPTYKWLTIHAGYRNLNFSEYTLGGHTILGGGFEINPGKFRAGAVYGRLNRATVIDSTSMSLTPFSFSRKGLAAKVGYGTSENYFDLSFLSAKDDSTTAPNDIIMDQNKVLAESNNVLGYQTRFKFAEKFFVESDGAISLYTSNINSSLSIDSTESVLLDKLVSLFNVNGSSNVKTALNAGIGYKERLFGIKLNYKRIEPGFKTMGAYFFSNDLESYTVNPSFILFNGKLRGNITAGYQRDNLLDQKQAQNERIIANASVTAQITNGLGLDFLYSNFSNNQSPTLLSFADSLKIVQTTQMVNISPRYMLTKDDKTHIIVLSANISGMKDYNSYFSDQSQNRDINTNQYLASYTLTFHQTGLSVFTNLNMTEMKAASTEDSYYGAGIGGSYSMNQNKIRLSLNTNVIQGNSSISGESLIINGNFNSTFKVGKYHSITALIYYTNNNFGKETVSGVPNFSETRGEIAYQFDF